MEANFTHLHLHSHYSLLDGLPKIDDILKKTKALNMNAVAITDHGVLYSAVEFYKKAKTAGIKPIIGAELYVAPEGMLNKRPNIDDKRYHLILLVKDATGYKNLVKLITKSHLDGFYYKPRIDNELLEKHSQGLIALSACIQGQIPKAIINNNLAEAKEIAKKYKELFGEGNFYLEIQEHPNIKEQDKANKGLIELSKELNIPLVVTNDCHYLEKDDAHAQDILMQINTGAKSSDKERLSMLSEDFSMKSPQELFDFCEKLGAKEAFENTQKIAQQCNFEFELGKSKLPCFQTPNNQAPEDYLKELAYLGLEKKKDQFPNIQEAKDRLEYELSVVAQTGFAGYFLIVQDFVNWAKNNRIVVGPGRGSAGGSLVAYLLNITEVNPLQYGLLFERFLNPERISMPDIDLDFTDRRRDEVIAYVSEKYGKGNVAQIITFGTMASRAVIRDVGRAMELPYSFCDQIAKMVPFGFSLNDCTEKVAEFRQLYDTDIKAKELIDFAKKLEGCARHASTHACGVVISKDPLDEIVPLQHPSQGEQTIVTQYEMHAIDDLGLLKMDFLGLKNLTIIEDALARIYKVHNQTIELASIPYDDPKTFKLFQKAQTTSVFQLESSGMKRYLKELKPSTLEDIVSMVALYRPGPMQFIPDYIDKKAGKKSIEYMHPKLEPILQKTYGICIYQEQLMQIARDVAGFTLPEADTLRKAIGKKIPELLRAQKDKFVEGVAKNGSSKIIGERLWEWVLPFAQYGFNKCLSEDTKILGANGRIRTIKQLVKESKRQSRPFRETSKSVVSLGDNLKLKAGKIIEISENGIKPVYQLKTRSGRKIEATLEHRFLTINGWKQLKELKPQEKIAMARSWPTNKLGQINLPSYKIATLAHVLSEGNTCHPAGFYLYTNSKEELEDFKDNLEKFPNTSFTITQREGKYELYAKRKNKEEESQAITWIKKDLNLGYKKATEKTIPQIVFRLKTDQIALFLGKIWNGDGCIDVKNSLLYYATSSEKMAEQMQYLLLRIGIFSKIHQKEFNYRGEKKKGWTISFSRYDNISKFNKFVSKHLVGKRKNDLIALINNHKIINSQPQQYIFARGTHDIVPVGVISEIKEASQELGISLKKVAQWAGISERVLWHTEGKKGLQRETLQKIALAISSQKLNNLAESDIFWDEIKSIDKTGEKQTYDLCIAQNHNFVANGFIVHNSHSVAYAIIAYYTAYLKAHYPVEFMASVLTSEKSDVERIAFLIDECKDMGIEVLQPDVNESFRNFSVIPKEKKIRFGLLAIKNVGENIVDTILTERKNNGAFISFADFVSRIDTKDFNKKSMEALIKTGAFDQFEERGKLLNNLEDVLAFNREIRKNKATTQASLFGALTMAPPALQLKESPPAPNSEKLLWEKELLGLYISSHPLENVKSLLLKKALPLKELKDQFPRQKIKIGGIISSIKKILTKQGQPMLFVKIEDLTDKAEVVVFPTIFEKFGDIFQENKIVFVTGRVDFRDNSPKLICEEIEEILEA